MAFTMDVDLPQKEEVVQQLQVPEPVKSEVQQTAEMQVEELLKVDVNSMESRRSITSVIEGFGSDTMTRSSSKNKLLETRIVELSKAGGETGVVAKSLGELNSELKDLDPSLFDFTKEGLLGKIFNPVREYFRKYEKADGVINNIMEQLAKGKQTLRNDNTTLEIEQQNIRQITLTCGKQIELGSHMDACLSQKIEEYKSQISYDEDKVKFIEEEVLFPLRQRLMDLQALQAVNQQSYFAMEVVRKNNLELIRAVDRAQQLTMTALRSAVMVASALYNQKIVLKCVTAVNETTNNIIESTSKMIKEQGVQIQQQAMETAINPDTLRQAFQNTFEALDSISTYKQQALPKMQAIMLEFREMADEGERRIQRLEQGYSVTV